MRILLVDDDEALMASLAQRLIRQRYAVDIAVDGGSADDYVSLFDYDLIVLDLILPDGDGIEFCRQFRRDGYTNPLMILTAKASTTEKVKALDAGADDYVIKPFDFDELCARIRALLRREHEGLPTVLEWGEVQLNPSAGELAYAQQQVRLTPKELSLMELFLRHPYRVHSLSSIMDDLWPLETPPGEDAIRTHIKVLRRKLRQAGAPKDLIRTVYGLGYRLNEEVAIAHSPKNAPMPFHQQNNRDQSSRAQSNRAQSNRDQSNINQSDRQPSPCSNQNINLSPASKRQLSAPDESATAPAPKVTCHYLNNAQKLVTEIEQAAVFLLTDTETASPQSRQRAYQKAQGEAQLEAQRNAHKLAGSLGSFGFVEGSRLAQRIESHLRCKPDMCSLDAYSLDTDSLDISSQRSIQKHEPACPTPVCDFPETVQLVRQLRQYIEAAVRRSTTSSDTTYDVDYVASLDDATPSAVTPSAVIPSTIWVLSEDDALIEQLTEAAADKPLKVTSLLASSIAAADAFSLADDLRPDLIILDEAIAEVSLPAIAPTKTASTVLEKLNLLGKLPTIALVDCVTLSEQRQLVAEGANQVMPRSESPQRIIQEVCRHLLKKQNNRLIRVAIADDDPTLLAHLQNKLSQSHPSQSHPSQTHPKDVSFSVSTFTSAQALWQWLHKTTDSDPAVDLLVLDVEMPEMDGIELCRVLRADAQFQQIPIIFLTIHDGEETRNLAFQVGADDFVSKADYTSQELASRIHNQIIKSSAYTRLGGQ